MTNLIKLLSLLLLLLVVVVVVVVVVVLYYYNFPETRKHYSCPAGDSLISLGEESSLALVCNPSRDSVSIKILVWRHLKPNSQLL